MKAPSLNNLSQHLLKISGGDISQNTQHNKSVNCPQQ